MTYSNRTGTMDRGLAIACIFVGLLGVYCQTAAAQVVRNWNNPTGGTFGSIGNWTPAPFPGLLDTARFDVLTPDDVYVSFLQSYSTAALRIVNGDISFNGAGLPPGTPSYSVDDVSIDDGSQLFLRNGTSPSTKTMEFHINNMLDLKGDMSIEDGMIASSSAAIVDSELMSATAELTVHGGDDAGMPSRLHVDDLTVSQNESGVVSILNGGYLSSASTKIGVNLAEQGLGFNGGTISVRGAGSDGSPSTWETSGPVEVGVNGLGRLKVQEGAYASIGATTVRHEVVIDSHDTTASPSRLETGNLTMSGGGVYVHNGGHLVSGNTVIGRDGNGILDIFGFEDEHRATWNSSGLLTVGDNSNGDVDIGRAGKAFTDSTVIGRLPGSDGEVQVRSFNNEEAAEWHNSGDVFVGGSHFIAGGDGSVELIGPSRIEIGGAVKIWPLGAVSMDDGFLGADSVQNTDGGDFEVLGGELQVRQFEGDLVNQGGKLAPGPEAAFTTIIGNYTQLSEASLAIEIGGTIASAEHDFVNVTGDTTLAGSLELAMLDNFVPESSDDFTIFASNSLVGSFNNVFSGQRLGTSDGSGSFIVNYGVGSPFDESRIVLSDFLVALLSGDYDGDGLVGAGDLNLVLGAWGENVTVTGVPSGWINELPTGVISANELNIVLNNWGTSSAMLATVPEPSSVFMIILGLVGLFQSKRCCE